LFLNGKKVKQSHIVGIDECGTGALAGDVFVCAFMAPTDWNLEGLNDSKKLSKKQREKIYEQLLVDSYTFSFVVDSCHPNDLDIFRQYGANLHSLLKYLYWSTAEDVLVSSRKEDALIVLDGNISLPDVPFKLGKSVSIPKADGLVPQVMAASVLAKVSRDHYMDNLSCRYPEYEWDQNKAYPTKQHLAAIKKYGICPEHRISYEPIRSMIKNEKS